MIDYNEIRERGYIVLAGEPYEVLNAHVFRKQQRKPVNATKLKNLITGKVVEYSFHQSDKTEEAKIDERGVIYLYHHRGEYWFTDKTDKKQRFKLDETTVGDKLRFITQNSAVKLLSFNGKIIGIKTPIKVAARIKETPEAVRGNTVQGGTKRAVLETGAIIIVPLFVNPGETIIVNTETGEYVGRGDETT